MRILVDENIPKGVSDWLRSTGHDVLVAAELRAGTPDIDWLAVADREQRCILTSDKDFGELVFRDGLGLRPRSYSASRTPGP
jgi:predicted nuclease of predicted toxin-antitoxin system